MTILRSKEGKLYDLPAESLKKYEVPANRVEEILAAVDAGEGSEGDVQPYGYFGGYGGGWYSPYYPPRRRHRYYYDYGY